MRLSSAEPDGVQDCALAGARPHPWRGRLATVLVLLAVVAYGAAPASALTWGTQASGTTNPLYGISCPTTSACYMVGPGGTILGTTDAGATWAAQSSGTTNQLNGVSCPTTSACWAVGASGTIVATTDGGVTWTAQSSGTVNTLNAVSCPTSRACWGVGESGTIVATTDGGATWNAQSSGTTYYLRGVSCPTTNACWTPAGGGGPPISGGILATANGGASWTVQSTQQLGLTTVSCPNDTTCWSVGSSGTINATTNAGANWTIQSYGGGATLNGISCPTVSACWAVGEVGTIVATNNGGTTWTVQGPGGGNILRGVSCPTTSACWAVGDSGTVVAAFAPTSTTPPRIFGPSEEGQTLTEDDGTWVGAPTPSFARQWRRCNATGANCSDIPGATGQTYTVTSADRGSSLLVNVTATNANGTAQASSEATVPVTPPLLGEGFEVAPSDIVDPSDPLNPVANGTDDQPWTESGATANSPVELRGTTTVSLDAHSATVTQVTLLHPDAASGAPDVAATIHIPCFTTLSASRDGHLKASALVAHHCVNTVGCKFTGRTFRWFNVDQLHIFRNKVKPDEIGKSFHITDSTRAGSPGHRHVDFSMTDTCVAPNGGEASNHFDVSTFSVFNPSKGV
jgi:photosystem II stability/assembly factor-like uncharacterized protein